MLVNFVLCHKCFLFYYEMLLFFVESTCTCRRKKSSQLPNSIGASSERMYISLILLNAINKTIGCEIRCAIVNLYISVT